MLLYMMVAVQNCRSEHRDDGFCFGIWRGDNVRGQSVMVTLLCQAFVNEKGRFKK